MYPIFAPAIVAKMPQHPPREWVHPAARRTVRSRQESKEPSLCYVGGFCFVREGSSDPKVVSCSTPVETFSGSSNTQCRTWDGKNPMYSPSGNAKVWQVDRDPKYLNYYERLGISEDAEHAEIAAAFRALRKEFHPDMKPAPYRDYFDHMMKGINEAYDILKEPAKRRQYDLTLLRERQCGRRERQGAEQREKENTTHERSGESYEDEARYQHCEWYGLVPTLADYACLVDSYEKGVSGFQRKIEGFRESFSTGVNTYESLRRKLEAELQQTTDPQCREASREWYRHQEKELARVEQAEKSNLLYILRAYDEEVFGELLAAIRYVERYLSGFPKHRRLRISAKHANLKRESSALLERKIVT